MPGNFTGNLGAHTSLESHSLNGCSDYVSCRERLHERSQRLPPGPSHTEEAREGKCVFSSLHSSSHWGSSIMQRQVHKVSSSRTLGLPDFKPCSTTKPNLKTLPPFWDTETAIIKESKASISVFATEGENTVQRLEDPSTQPGCNPQSCSLLIPT